MRQRIARATGAIFIGLLVLIFVGLFVGWLVSFLGMTTLAFWELARLSKEATDAPTT